VVVADVRDVLLLCNVVVLCESVTEHVEGIECAKQEMLGRVGRWLLLGMGERWGLGQIGLLGLMLLLRWLWCWTGWVGRSVEAETNGC